MVVKKYCDGSDDDDGYGGHDKRCCVMTMLEKDRKSIRQRGKNLLFDHFFYFLTKGNFGKMN